MKWVTGLSYRLKIPLAITIVIVLTETVVTAALLSSASADARRDLEASALNLAAVVARSVREPMLRDDLWQAYEVIRTPLEVRSPGNPLQSIVIFDCGESGLRCERSEALAGICAARRPAERATAPFLRPWRRTRTFRFDAPESSGAALFTCRRTGAGRRRNVPRRGAAVV